MKPITETLDILQSVSKVADTRLDDLRRNGADPLRIQREEWRRKLLDETIKAIEETVQTN